MWIDLILHLCNPLPPSLPFSDHIFESIRSCNVKVLHQLQNSGYPNPSFSDRIHQPACEKILATDGTMHQLFWLKLLNTFLLASRNFFPKNYDDKNNHRQIKYKTIRKIVQQTCSFYTEDSVHRWRRCCPNSQRDSCPFHVT